VSNPSFTHDGNGNLLTGAGITATWTSFNMVNTVTRYGATDRFHYGADQERIVQESPTRLTLYALSSGFELEAPFNSSNCNKQVTTGCVWEARIYVQAEGKARAMLIDSASGQKEWRYMHHDHLGSVVAVSNSAGDISARYGFDAWGARRNANGTAGTGGTSEVDRGYTGHEMLDNVGLVHMNGRIYDGQIARMLSADPTIPEPGNLQAYSRYAYVFNDPINRWDPSGYKPKWGNILAGIAIGWFVPQFLAAQYLGGMETMVSLSSLKFGVAKVSFAMIGGFTGGLVASGGDLNSAFAGAITGGMFTVAGSFAGVNGALTPEQFGMHLAAGCVSGALGGGGSEGCARGAVAQGFSKLVTFETRNLFKGNDLAHGVIASVSGGTVSAITGGKFANGAITGAFGYVLNEMGQTKGAQSYGAGTREGEHFYMQWSHVGTLDQANIEAWRLWAMSFGYPGSGLEAQPFEVGSSRTVYAGIPGVPNSYRLPAGQIFQSVGPGGSVINTTLVQHSFCCGQVDRSVVAVGNNVYVLTLGTGINFVPFTLQRSTLFALINAKVGPRAFADVDNSFRSFMSRGNRR
jgi:RHS repeat-associated protein